MKIAVYSSMMDIGPNLEDMYELLNDCDYVFALDKDSFSNLKLIIPEDKAKLVPKYIQGQDSFEEWIREESGRDDIEFVSYKTVCESSGIDLDSEINSIADKIDKLESKKEDIIKEMDKRLDPDIKEAISNLNNKLQERKEYAEDLIGSYIIACQEGGFDEDQSNREAEQYINTEMPEVEFMCPVSILRPLRDGMEGFDMERFLK